MTLTLASITVTFDHLWQFAQKEAAQLSALPESVFHSIGLRLELPTKAWKYYCTPRNAKTFASTGCDGVHYSFLDPELLSYSQQNRPVVMPVVMTVPMSFDNPNIVVAETLYEFLCLGCRSGYFALETLSSCEGDFSALKSNDYAADLSRLQRGYLQKLSRAFSLVPYDGALGALPRPIEGTLEGRLAQLQSKYLDCLRMGEVKRVAAKRVAAKPTAPAAVTFGQFA